ncbi:ETX/MTX2 family pore-forming toxin [Streptomyces sp. NPDC007861]|uniref:ETX/MTX2 family pore-forming toxin n=1 Tax=Streptomyces sp. NPDC007861 TaxID=3154893 RepID=UPI0033ECD704
MSPISRISRRKALALSATAGAAALSATALRAAAPASAATGRPAASASRATAGQAPRSLQQITDAWGDWMARSRFPGSGGYRFTESTDYGRRGELNAYHQHQVAAKYTGIVYDASAPSPVPGEVTSVVTNYRNDTELEQNVSYRQSLTTERNLRISVTESLQIGVSMTVEATIPAVASIGETTTITTSLSSTQEFALNKSQSWSVDLPLRIPARSRVEATLVVGTQEYDIDWTATAALNGDVAIWFNNKVDLNHDGDMHWLWFVPIEWVLSDAHTQGLIDTTGYDIVGDGVNARARGTFSGGQGISVNVNTRQYPVSGQRGADSVSEQRIPLHPDGKQASRPAG